MTYCTQYTLHMTPAQHRHDKSAPLVTMGHMAQYYALGWAECTSMKGVCAVCSGACTVGVGWGGAGWCSVV